MGKSSHKSRLTADNPPKFVLERIGRPADSLETCIKSFQIGMFLALESKTWVALPGLYLASITIYFHHRIRFRGSF